MFALLTSSAATVLCLLAITTSAPQAQAAVPSRGIAWPWFETVPAKTFYLKGKTEWVYNWELYYPTGGAYKPMEFVPMVRTASEVGQIASADSLADAKWVLGFNEPDMTGAVGGAAMTPKDAAALWKKYIAPLRTSTRKLVAPAVSVSGAKNQGYDWLQQFLAACTGCKFDAYAVHPYSGNADQVQSILDTWLNTYKVKPLWVTEFGTDGSGGTGSGGKAFVESMIQYFNGKDTSEIQRYSMMARQNQNKSYTGKDLQFSNGTLRAMGKKYRTYSTTTTTTTCEA